MHKKVVTVLGSGRSGTSLIMNILSNGGMSVSKQLLKAEKRNPLGYYEDLEILNIHKQIFTELGATPTLPLQDGWLSLPPVQNWKKQLKSIVNNNIQNSSNIWGFKEPRTTLLLELWIEIFEEMKIEPIFILSVRNPAAVIQSLKYSAKSESDISEFLWLFRTCLALKNTDFNCYIVHYEDLINKNINVISHLINHIGLDFEDVSLLEKTIIPELNHFQTHNFNFLNSHTSTLYNLLKKTSGITHDQNLHSTVSEILFEISNYKSVTNQAQRYCSQILEKNKTISGLEDALKIKIHENLTLKKNLDLTKTIHNKKENNNNQDALKEELIALTDKLNKYICENIELKNMNDILSGSVYDHNKHTEEMYHKDQQIKILTEERNILALNLSKAKKL